MYQRRWEGSYATDSLYIIHESINHIRKLCEKHYSDDECMFVVQRNTSDCKRLATVERERLREKLLSSRFLIEAFMKFGICASGSMMRMHADFLSIDRQANFSVYNDRQTAQSHGIKFTLIRLIVGNVLY
ncbi:hypothetical protein T09_4447 [Trichinella sp. T9]|nr:hypothetical protein T09_4447 [Trichinella sp. T9]